MKKFVNKQNFLLILLLYISTIANAQKIIPVSLNTKSQFNDVEIKTASDGSYLLKISGANPYITFNKINDSYNFKDIYVVTFDCKTNARIGDFSLFYGDFKAKEIAKTYALTPSEKFTTIKFNLKSYLTWDKSSKNFRLAFKIPKGKDINIKNIQLRAPTKKEIEEQPLYLDNGIVRIGVDMTGGGSIFHFSESKTRRNLLNHADKGRFIQQSYYGEKDGSLWGSKPWNWNPVQGGGSSESGSSPAKVLESKVSKNSIYIKSLPKHWATGEDIVDAIMEETISLKGNLAHIVYTFRYNGTTVHPNRAQELPAVFVDYALPNLVFYKGEKPFTKDTLTSVIPGWPNQPQRMDENWAAYVDDNQWGIGVYVPGTTNMTTYRHNGDLVPGEFGAACSYFAPIRKFSIKPEMIFTYDVYLSIDKIDAMREAFYNLRK